MADKSVNKIVVNGDVLIDLTLDTVTDESLLAGYTAHDSSGEVISGTMPNRGSAGSNIQNVSDIYTIPKGYHDGTGKVSILASEQAKMISRNIREGITLLGVAGNMTGLEDVRDQTVVVTPNFTSQEIVPDKSNGYNYLSKVTINSIPISETPNDAGGTTIVIG